METRLAIVTGHVFLWLVCVFCMPVSSFAQYNETLTIATYYPSPYGVYDKMRSNKLTLGDVTADTGFVLEIAGRNAAANGIGTDRTVAIYPKSPTDSAGIVFAQSKAALNAFEAGTSFPVATMGMGNLNGHYGADLIAGDFGIATASGGDMHFSTRYPVGSSFTYTRMIIKNNGNVGIGTTNCVDKLCVESDSSVATIHARGVGAGNTYSQLVLDDDADWTRNSWSLAFKVAAAGNSFIIQRQQTDGTTLVPFGISGDGKVGIGNWGPAFALDVTGEIRISGVSAEVGKAVCVKGDGSLGTCTGAVGGTGSCPCS